MERHPTRPRLFGIVGGLFVLSAVLVIAFLVARLGGAKGLDLPRHGLMLGSALLMASVGLSAFGAALVAATRAETLAAVLFSALFLGFCYVGGPRAQAACRPPARVYRSVDI